MKLENLQETIENDIKEFVSAGKISEQIFEFKSLSTEKKIEILDFLLKREDLLNSNIILNLILLVKKNNIVDDKLWESKTVWFTDLEEFLDIKIQLKQQIEQFVVKLIKYYLGVIKSVGLEKIKMVDSTVLQIPITYQRLLLVLDFESLSYLMKHLDISLSDIPLVEGAINILTNLSCKLTMLDELFKSIPNETKGDR